MLRQLSITNLGLIETAEIEFNTGLQVVTGETGVGKSLLVNSLAILAGARVKSDWIRRGCDEARVVGYFSIDDEPRAAQIDELTGLNCREDGVRVERRLREGGRHRTLINGEEIPLSMLRRIGALIVEIHGQRAQLSLLEPAAQLDVVDRFASLMPQRKAFAEAYRAVVKRAQEIDRLLHSQRERNDRRVFLTHVLAELEEAELQPGERESLEQGLGLLEERERVLSTVSETLHELLDSDDSVLDRLSRREREVEVFADLHAGLKEFVSAIGAARASLDEGLRSLQTTQDDLDRDPAALEESRSRLDRLVELEERYRRTADELIRYREEVRAELDAIVEGDEQLPELQAAFDTDLADLAKRSRTLTRRRRAAAKKLSQSIGTALGDLGMPAATLTVSVDAVAEADDKMANSVVPDEDPMIQSDDEPRTETGLAKGRLTAFEATGSDRVEFLFGPNPGEPPRPLRRIASGGELSRVMLAIESELATADRVPVLVFDEIDSGVGGRLGTEIGRKLRDLGAHHQVFCVTHLPQVACFGADHFHVDKSVTRGRTKTEVRVLTGEERERELAAMIRGSAESATSRTEAREMLEDALRETT